MLILAAVGHCFKHAKLKTHFRDPLRRQDVAFVDSPTTSKMSNLDVEDFIQQNRAVADQVDTFRGYWESEKHWQPRREFILRNINDFQPQQLDHLLSLSMVWANNVFLGCRYNAELLEKVSEMAEGIEVEDAPVFKTRDEIMKKQQGR